MGDGRPSVSPVKETAGALNAKFTAASSTALFAFVLSVSSSAMFYPGRKRTMTPAREPDQEPLRPVCALASAELDLAPTPHKVKKKDVDAPTPRLRRR